MKKIIYILALLPIILASCVDNNFHDTGLANGDHDCSLLDYLKSDHKNYDSLVPLIQQAGLEQLFEGNDPASPEITFFAPTNMSIIHYLDNNKDDSGNRLYTSVSDIPANECRQMLLSYIITGKHKRTDFAYEVKGTLEGGTPYTTLTNLTLRAYRIKGSWNGVSDIGPDGIGIHFIESGFIGRIASGDINTINAVVHALSTEYELVNPTIYPLNNENK